MAQTNLQHLFRQVPTSLVTPLENFTSAALAIAINHDPQPLLRVFQQTSWKQATSGRPSVDLATATSVTASVQEYLPSGEGDDSGYLDLVMVVIDRQ